MLVEERRRRAPDAEFFLFEDRAYDAREVGERIDNVVRGLISIGVRQGEHVGVLMGPRPSALALVVAISRVGAVAVLMRPDGDLEREARLGQVERIIADPERAQLAAGLGCRTHVRARRRRRSGGPGGDADVIDMEGIDPAAVQAPALVPAQPGAGRRPRVHRVQRRGREHAGEPDHQPPLGAVGVRHRLLGGADAGRHAVQRDAGLPPVRADGQHRRRDRRRGETGDGAPVRGPTFWEEIRRYGVTVATYTWTLLDEIVEAPPQPAERHHPLRLFIGSGMPRGLWRRVEQRFKPARVVEFYASTEAGAILVNLGRGKIGAMGRPLPGSAEVRIARYDLDAQGLVLNRDGFAKRCGIDEVGMLMVRVGPTEPLSITPLRSLFRRDDAWVATGDLFRRDADGDYWRVDGVADVIHTAPVLYSRRRSAMRSGISRPSTLPSPTARPRGGPGRDRGGGGHGARRPVAHRRGTWAGAGGCSRARDVRRWSTSSSASRSPPGSGR